jgi:hypothetical protein
MSERFKYGGVIADDPRVHGSRARDRRRGLAFFPTGPGKATLSGCQRGRVPKTTEIP